MKRLLSVLVLALACVSCGGSDYMHELQTPQAVAAEANMATVVFIRPSGYGGGSYPILDHTGKLLGEAMGETYFVAKMPPGQYMFIAWSEGTPAMRATVEAGKIYYVEVGMTIGAWSARARLFAVGPNRKQWAELPEWLAESVMTAPNPGAIQAFAQNEGGDVPEILQKGNENFAEYDPEEVAERSLLPADGVDVPVAPLPGG